MSWYVIKKCIDDLFLYVLYLNCNETDYKILNSKSGENVLAYYLFLHAFKVQIAIPVTPLCQICIFLFINV